MTCRAPQACALLLVVATGLAQYALYQHGFYAKSGDESARIILAREWAEHKLRLQPEIWLPFPKYLTGVALEVYDDTMVAPWVANGIVGTLLVAALGALTWSLFRQGETTLFSMLLAACFGPRLVIAAVPWSESLYCLTLVLALTFLARWLSTHKTSDLCATGFWAFLSTGTRYEAWLVAACLAAVCMIRLVRDAKTLSTLGILLATLAYPVFWVGLWQTAGGHAFGFLSASGNRYFELANPNHLFFKTFCDSMPAQFFAQNAMTMNLLGLAAIIPLSLRQGPLRTWLMVPLLSFAAMAAVSLAGLGLPSHNFWRTPVLWSLLLIPFTAHWIMAQTGFLGGKARYARLIAGAVLIAAFLLQAAYMTRKSDMDTPDFEAGQAVRNFLERPDRKATDSVHIQGGRYHNLHVAVASGHTLAFLNPWHTSGENDKETIDLPALKKRGARLLVLPQQQWAKTPIEGLHVLHTNPRWVVAECPPPPF